MKKVDPYGFEKSITTQCNNTHSPPSNSHSRAKNKINSREEKEENGKVIGVNQMFFF